MHASKAGASLSEASRSARGKLFKTGLAACASIVLAACATLTPPTFTTPADRALSGRMSVHYKNLDTDHEETLHAGFDWAQHGSAIDFTVLDPLGQSVALVHVEPGRAQLTMNDGRKFEGESPEALTLDTLGFAVPVAGLSAWLDGKPATSLDAKSPAATAVTLADGTFQIQQDGWTVHYPEYKDTDPLHRIDLSYPGPGVSVELRLVIDHREGQSGQAAPT